MGVDAARRRGGRGVAALVVLVLGLGIAAGQMYPVPPAPVAPPPPAKLADTRPADPVTPPKRRPILVSSSDDGLLILPAAGTAPASPPAPTAAPLPPG
ncbi:MAG TPA: hypothetical protein VM529_00505, partial [Gemmata sp.]|nr:hypothetical protein [Gemmata sp.]